MPEKYHIKTKPIPPRRPRIGKYGIVDWREDCARCHNCVKKACVYDRHRQELEYIRNLSDVDVLFFDCMGCLYCVQNCTKGLLRLTINPELSEVWGTITGRLILFKQHGLRLKQPKFLFQVQVTGGVFQDQDSIRCGRICQKSFVQPEMEFMVVNISVPRLILDEKFHFFLSVKRNMKNANPPLLNLPMPIILDMPSEQYSLAEINPVIQETAKRTGIIAIVESKQWSSVKDQEDLSHMHFILIRIRQCLQKK